jgi:hypothetical protein
MNMDPIERKRDVDQWLEAALSQYGKAEPRTGLKSRVLASLQAERNRVASTRRWWWGAALAAVAAIVAAVWLGLGERARTPAGADSVAIRHDDGAGDHPTIDRPAIDRPATHPVPRSSAEQLARRVWRRPPSQPTPYTPEVAYAARLERFPAPTPLSDQEKLLARYVQQFPQRAALIARAQTDLRERNELEMAAPWPKKADSNSLEQQQ